jgi:TolA-binding protein
MKFRSLLVCVLLAAPMLAPGANKEIQELQRDIGLLQQQIRDLQRSQDEKFAAVMDLARKSLEAANLANNGVVAVTENVARTLRPLQESLAAPLAGINSRLTQTSDDVRALQQAMNELASTVNGLQAKLDDLKTIFRTFQQPVAPPPVQQPLSGDTKPPMPDKPSMPAGDLYMSALSDYRSARYDLALQGFNEYLKFYGTDNLAPNAQFYIGMIHYTAKSYDQAANDFDTVLEHYTRNSKTDEAMLYKGKSLVALGKRDDGVKEFRQLLKESPKSDPAKLACDELKNVGLGCAPAATAPNRGGVAKRSKK